MKPLFLIILMFTIISGVLKVNAQNQFDVLVFSKTTGYRHDSILEGVEAIRLLGQKHHFGVTWTEDASIFKAEELKKYQVVVFLNNSDDIFNEDQKQAFKQFINNGGGFVGIHAATATEFKWEWYGKLLGRFFEIHPKIQTAVMKVVDKNFPATFHLPDHWLWTEEWYEFQEPLVEDLHVLITVDESTYDPKVTWEHTNQKSDGMGAFHPIAWYHEFDGGRSFYTALGHIGVAYKDPLFLEHIYGGIFWAATGIGIAKK